MTRAYVLEGRVVTMDPAGTVLDQGQVVVVDSRVQAVLPAGAPLPDGLADIPRLQTGGTIYPGLIDLHNHFVYNVLGLWRIPKLYANRDQWRKEESYKREISRPMQLLAADPDTARAVFRYVEVKAVCNGTTTGQGIRTRNQGDLKWVVGLMRNVEAPGDDALVASRGSILDLKDKMPEEVDRFRRAVNGPNPYFYHLSEGRDPHAHGFFDVLVEKDLLGPALIGIHSLALTVDDLRRLHASGGKVVWSPFSNALLYGSTLDIGALLDSGIPFSVGCDWSPSGSPSLMNELRVARWFGEQQGRPIPAIQLVRSVTSAAAGLAGWEGRVGVVTAGAFADLLVLDGTAGDPYDALINATQSSIRLVVTDGRPAYGDAAALATVLPGAALEALTVSGRARALSTEGTDARLMSFEAASNLLSRRVADLEQYRQELEQAGLLSGGPDEEPEFGLVLDMQDEEPLDSATLMAGGSPIAATVPLDPIETGAAWRATLASQPNLADGLKAALLAAGQA